MELTGEKWYNRDMVFNVNNLSPTGQDDKKKQ